MTNFGYNYEVFLFTKIEIIDKLLKKDIMEI